MSQCSKIPDGILTLLSSILSILTFLCKNDFLLDKYIYSNHDECAEHLKVDIKPNFVAVGKGSAI